MGSPLKFQQDHHPFVAALIQGKPLHGAINSIGKRSLSPIEEVIVLLNRGRTREALSVALAKAATVSLRHCEPNLAIIFYAHWCQALWQFPNREEETTVALARAKSLVDSDTPVEIRALLNTLEGLWETDRTGNHNRTLQLFSETLHLLGRESARYDWHVLVLARILSRQGRLAKIDGELNQVLARSQKRHHAQVAVYRFCNATETGQLDEAQRWYEAACRDPQTDEALNLYERPLFYTYLVLQREPDSLKDPQPEWVQIYQQLLARRPTEALRAARAEALRLPNKNLNDFGFDSWGLLRAELSNGHARAARRLLVQRQRRGNMHFLDEFFYARIEMLEGNAEAAARHFADVLQAAEFYGAQARLDFELDLACELTARDVSRLYREAAAFRDAVKFMETETLNAAEGPLPTPSFQAGGGTLSKMVGVSTALKVTRKSVARFAPLDATVLITGETGTGKELIARALHEAGPRRVQPFVAVNCGAISETLLESELFGHEQGAFTGAARAHQGLFEQAGAGTIFLDEIGEISPRLQVALLRVLESGEYRPVGSKAQKRAACRILAATNADLQRLAEEGRFRLDLLFRLRGLEISVPPLRERPEDILPLMKHFLAADRADGHCPVLDPEVRDVLIRYEWPGNVRELRSTAELMRLLNSENPFHGMDTLELVLPQARRAAQARSIAKLSSSAKDPPQSEWNAKRSRLGWRQMDRLRELFQQHRKMNRAEVARLLDVTPKTATGYLKKLCQEGIIRKVKPSASPRSHHFAMCS